MGSRSSNKIRNRKFPLIFILYFSLLSGCFCSHYSRIEMSWWKQITLSYRNRIQNENKKHTGEYQTFFSTSNAIFILHTFVSFFSRLSSSFEAITFVFQKKLLHFFRSSKVSFFSRYFSLAARRNVSWIFRLSRCDQSIDKSSTYTEQPAIFAHRQTAVPLNSLSPLNCWLTKPTVSTN